jgi:hypothetical protein
MNGKHPTGEASPFYKHGLYLEQRHTCPCGLTFSSRNPAARYCSNACRIRYGQYGRTTYGQTLPRVYGTTRS